MKSAMEMFKKYGAYYCENDESEIIQAMEEYAAQFKPTAEANPQVANTVLDVPLLSERKGCNCCGGELVFIRGKYPKDEQREICPTCAYERLEEIRRISDADYGKTYC